MNDTTYFETVAMDVVVLNEGGTKNHDDFFALKKADFCDVIPLKGLKEFCTLT